MRKDTIRNGRVASNAIITVSILFFLGQALGISRIYFDIRVFGYELHLVWIIVATVLGFLYAEINDTRRESVKARLETSQITERVAKQVEEAIATIQAKLKER